MHTRRSRDRLSGALSGRGRKLAVRALVALGLVAAVPAAPWAHEVPPTVVVKAFIENTGRAVRVLVRVPLEAMRDVAFPLRGPGYLDLARADSTLRDAAQLWVADAVDLWADGQPLPRGRIVGVRASLPSDRAFERYASAQAVFVAAPLAITTDVAASRVMLDVALEYPVASASARLALHARFARLGVRTTTALTVVYPTGTERAYMYDGDAGILPLEPSWWHAASRFVFAGARHLLQGIDHLLFLVCLILPVRKLRPLVGIVTAFTVAHSMTLMASALGYAPTALWFPPLVELLIAASIVYMAVENIIGARLEKRWLVAFACGLVHGFGFSYVLRETLQFAGAHVITALAAFNLGLELGQLVVIAVVAPAVAWLLSHVSAEKPLRIVLSVLVGHTAWHWMAERWDVLRTYRLVWPAMDLSLAVTALRSAMAVLLVGATVWALSGFIARLTTERARGSTGLLLLCASLGLCAALAVAPLASAQDSTRSTMTGVYTLEQATKGKEVFTGICVGCHTSVSQSGADFAVRWVGKALWEFYRVVSTLMPESAPATLSESEYVWVTAYVLKLNNMPAGERELTADSLELKNLRIDTLPLGSLRNSGGVVRHGARIR